MIQIVVTGHGRFASGILTSMRLIAGEQQRVMSVDFADTDSTEDLKQKLERALEGKDKVLILSDLAGGSPYNVSVILKTEHTEKEIEVLSGTNLAMVLACVFSGSTDDVTELTQEDLEEGKAAVAMFCNAVRMEAPEEEDGI